MAASEPASSVHSWATDPERESHGDLLGTESLELGMSGMSLIGSGHKRKPTGSTVSTTPPDDSHSEVGHHQGPHLADYSSARGSTPPSPGSDKNSTAGMQSQTRPPGLSGPLPSPIGQHGHSKNTSATSPSLTLTPNSSVDAHSDWASIGRQNSPFPDPPSIPFLPPEHRRGADGGFGSADLGAGDDGLMGLGALRERSYSSPGGISSSPPVARGHLSAHVLPQQQFDQQFQDRPRGRDRPPRSHPYESYANYQGDRSVGGVGLPLSAPSSRSDLNNVSLESNDSRYLGAISRPDMRQTAPEFDPTHLRSSSADNYQNPYSFQQHPLPSATLDHLSNKFGSLPTLGAHLQQQRAPENYSTLPKPRHVRSVSQPGPSFGPSPPQQQQLPPGIDPRYYNNSVPTSRHSFASGGSYREGGGVARSISMNQTMLTSSYDNSRYSQKGTSMPNLGMQQQSGYPSLQRRDALDFQISPVSQSNGSVIASADEIRAFGGQPSTISPGQSPLQTHYGSHSRQGSDSGTAIMSSSPMSMGSSIFPSSTGSVHARFPSSNDDDLAHPLLGEHIEVPEHDDPSIHGVYSVQGGGHHPLLHGPSHTHSRSMDQMPPQYIEAPHHLPTAGASLPCPKVVYSVKFKRTQRNFVLGPRINRVLKIGTYVKVEADRGEDLGIVVGKTSAEKFGFSARTSFTAGMGPSIGGSAAADLKRIIRLATHDEVSLLSMKREEEEELLKICRAKVRQRGLPMNVVDAEYQFDRHKLTFFFEAEGRVDFRELVRDLFSMYKTRIWMQQLDKNTSTSAPAIMAPQAANLEIDYGTPIIAPEFAGC